MLNPFCQCFFFWSKNDDEPTINNEQFSLMDQPDVCLDVSRAGLLFKIQFRERVGENTK